MPSKKGICEVSLWAAVLSFAGETSSFVHPTVARRGHATTRKASAATAETATIVNNDKDVFLRSLDGLSTLNQASKERSMLLNTMIENKISSATTSFPNSSSAPSIDRPGSQASFQPVATGNWKVIYAPHMTTMGNLAKGSFQVEYDLKRDGKMTSHAKYDFPFVGKGYLSVSGTYGSVSDNVCRVDFDEAWVRPVFSTEEEIGPYETIDEVPESLIKSIIRSTGRFFFFDGVSVFPVSFLDNNLIVFDFELLGTRICAMKS